MQPLVGRRARSGMSRFYGISLCLIIFPVVLLSASCYCLAHTIENDLLKAGIDGRGCLSSWYLKKFEEDLFGFEFSLDEKGRIWRRAGMTYGYAPTAKGGQDRNDSGVEDTLDVIVRATGRNLVVVSSDDKGKALPKGIELTESWRFSERYSARLELTIENKTDHPVSLEDSGPGKPIFYIFPLFRGNFYRSKIVTVTEDSGKLSTLSPGTGRYQVLGDESKWVGVISQYYCMGIKEKTSFGRYTCARLQTYIKHGKRRSGPFPASLAGWKLAWKSLRAHDKITAVFEIYMGPKQQEELEKTSFPELFDTWNGYTGPIGRLMFRLLKKLYGVTGSYGYAILLLTLLVKLLLMPLNRKQMLAMKKMQQLQPKIKEIKERFKDPQQQQAEMQKLFIEYQVNPMAGCLPVLLQLPIFVALYTSLSSAIELKNVSFWWLPDLSKPDPLLILPLSFSIGIYFSSRASASGAGGDQTQATMMKIMPVMMFFVFRNMTSGVMLYIAGQSMFSMLEQHFNRLTCEGGTVFQQAVTVEVKKDDVDSSQTHGKSASQGIPSRQVKKAKKKKRKK